MIEASSSNNRHVVITRKATAADMDNLLTLIHGLATYEKLAPPDAGAERRLQNDLFGPHPRIEAFLAESDGKCIGYAIVFESYSSFLALPTLYLEDIFVLPEYRGRGAGIALFRMLVGEAQNRGCGRMEWAVLAWNQLAIRFYNELGATHLKEWHLFRLTREEMPGFLESSPPGKSRA